MPIFKKNMPTAINEQIKALTELQKIDFEIHELKKELDSQPLRQKRMDEDFEKKKTALKAVEADLRGIQLKQKEKEIDLQSREEKIKKLQAQLYQLKSNKEYSAMELGIKGLKADNSLLEEDILKLMDALETARQTVTRERQALTGEEAKFKEASDALKKEAEFLQTQATKLDVKRQAYRPNIDPKLLSQYEKLLKSREGLGLVPVKNNACGGCHLRLPPQIINEIQMQEKLIVCESCARILYSPT